MSSHSYDVLRKGHAPTADWLTDRLRRAGLLERGTVRQIHVRPNDAFTSQVMHIEVTYDDDASPRAATQLILKQMDRGWGEIEIAFYRLADLGLDMLVRCYDAAFDPASGDSHLLLEDVSATHAPAVARADLLAGNGVPHVDRLEAIMRAIARFHARWWEDPRIGGDAPFTVRGWYGDGDAFEQHLERRARELSVLSDVPGDVRELYARALDRLPGLYERFLATRITDRRALTLTHGDCYLTQWLSPRAPGGRTHLVDFDSASANLAAFDLVYLLASFWTRPQRRENEQACLRWYHDELARHGVEGLAWADLLADYRLMLAFYVFDPVFDHASGAARDYWWPKMRCLTAAYEDWGCDSL